MNKIALSMIVKGTGKEPQRLKNALLSIAPHVDGIFITLTGPRDKMGEAEKVCKEFKVVVSYGDFYWTATKEAVEWLTEFFGEAPNMKVGDKIFLFDEARNYSLSQIPSEYTWFTWMDCDDVMNGAENIRPLVEESEKNGIEAYYFNYIYQAEFTPEGEIKNVLIKHLRERLMKNIGVFKWISPIHETLIEQRPTAKMDTPRCEVIHLAQDEDRQASLMRNLKSLELSIYQTKGEDPRHIYYLAKALFDLATPETNDQALKLMYSYLLGKHSSGWREERAQAWEYLCEIYRRKGEHNNAIKACLNALVEEPQSPSIYINIALSYMHMKEWDRAIFWVKLATNVPERKTTLVSNPKDLQARTLEILYNSCLNLSKVDEAWSAMVKLVELFPEDQGINQAFQAITMLRQERDLTKEFVGIADYLRKSGQAGKIKALLSAAPALIQQNPFLTKMYQENNPPKPWGDNEIAIYCGQGFTNWSPKTLVVQGDSFVGGSEEAVIYMAEALAKQGWKVTVYNDPGSDEGEINGVTWLPYYKFNRLDNFNILIAWRDIRFFDSDFNAKKKYLWNHDIQNPMEYTKERLDRINKIFFLSKWHRDNVPDLAEDKVMLTSNGVL